MTSIAQLRADIEAARRIVTTLERLLANMLERHECDDRVVPSSGMPVSSFRDPFTR